jgi:tetratricopeptide (TPR) repeat protein
MHMIDTVTRWIRAAVIGAFVLSGSVGLSSAAEQAVTNKEVAKHLTQARKLAGGKQWNAALEELAKAEKVPEGSAYARYKINEFKAYVLTQQRKYGNAADVFEQLGGSDQASAGDRLKHMKTAASLYMEAKQYQKAARLAERALEIDRADVSLLKLAGQAKYLAADYEGAARTMSRLVSAVEKKGGKPEEESLQILLNSYYKLNDRDQITRSWERLLRHYPKPKYWQNVLELKAAESHPERVELYYRALMFDLGMLRDPEDYEALALGALDLGLPSISARVVEAGLQNRILARADEARFRRMLEYAQREVAKSAGGLKDLADRARRASTGQTDVILGRAYLSQEKYKEAIAALLRGFDKGQLQHPDQARIDLGVAYLKSNDPKQAREIFSAIKADSEWRDLADLWSLRASEVARR